MENFNTVPSQGKFGDSIEVVNENFLLAKQGIDILENIVSPNTKYVTAEANSQTTSVTEILPAIGSVDTIYRVGNWNGTAYDVTAFSEYAWYENNYKHLSTKSQIDEVFDISVYKSTGGALAKFVDLTEALGTNGANVPNGIRKGGMSIKFVHTSDNKYVQWRLMSTTWSTDESDWQGVDTEITAGSKNLAESGAVYNQSKKVVRIALANNGTACTLSQAISSIPNDQKYFGMSIKFLSSASNEIEVWSNDESYQSYDVSRWYKENTVIEIEGKGTANSGSVADGFAKKDAELAELTDLQQINLTTGGYINTGGDSVDVSSVTSDSSYEYAVVECEAGDVFVISGTGGGSPRLWCFINSQNAPVTRADSNATENNKIIPAPNSAVKLIVNNKISSGHKRLFKGTPLKSLLYPDGSEFLGTISPSGSPKISKKKLFYIPAYTGIYTNFGNKKISDERKTYIIRDKEGNNNPVWDVVELPFARGSNFVNDFLRVAETNTTPDSTSYLYTMYIAKTPGTYTNFLNAEVDGNNNHTPIVVNVGELALLRKATIGGTLYWVKTVLGTIEPFLSLVNGGNACTLYQAIASIPISARYYGMTISFLSSASNKVETWKQNEAYQSYDPSRWVKQNSDVTLDSLGTANSGAVAAITDIFNAQFAEILFDSINTPTTGGYINTNGDTVNVSSVTSDSSFEYSVVDCVAGDTFVISGKGGGSPRLWCFIDSNGVPKLRSNQSVTETHKIIIAPTGAVKLIVNNNYNTYGHVRVYKGTPLKTRLEELINTLDVDTAVANYLNAHPELVTTVQDGAITLPKFASSVIGTGSVSGVVLGKGNGLSSEQMNYVLATESFMHGQDGSRDIVMGYHSLYRGRDATYNVSIGNEASDNVSHGSNNTAVGSNALRQQIPGIGDESEQTEGTTTNSNTAIGADSMYYHLGDRNTVIGRGALSGQWDRSNGYYSKGNNNTVIGASALGGWYTDVTKGERNNCVAIGSYAGYRHNYYVSESDRFRGFVENDGDNYFYLDSVSSPRATNAEERANSLLFGKFAATAIQQILSMNAGKILMPYLPTSDPQTAGQLWNDNGVLKISSGS